MQHETDPAERWYAGVTRYQWLVLAIACLGWMFDVFEGQIYAVYKSPAMESLLEARQDGVVHEAEQAVDEAEWGVNEPEKAINKAEKAINKAEKLVGEKAVDEAKRAIHKAKTAIDEPEKAITEVKKAVAEVKKAIEEAKKAIIDWFSNVGLASFLIGGTVGGLLFGILADRIGRRQTMVWSILLYSVFTGLHYFAANPWHVVVLRFFVAVGVAGEWAIAASFVAEVFPKTARTVAGGVFHASSVVGAVLGSAVGVWVISKPDWRWAFVLGVLPALLVVWVLVSLRESERWQADRERSAHAAKKKSGSLRELLGVAQWRKRALIGMGLAAVGLGTYWAIYAWGPELVGEVLGNSLSDEERFRYGSFAYMLMNGTGGFAGLLLFAPLSMFTSRRAAFAFYHVGAIIIVPITYLAPNQYWHTLLLLPVMAFFVVGMHAGYAIYFPELFPTRLRATGASFCFNVGRLTAAVVLLVRGWLREWLDLRWAVTVMASLFIVGLILLWFAPETKDKELPA